MLVPIKWLKDFVEIDLTPDEIRDVLVSCGFEIEAINDLSTQIIKVYTAEITKTKPHPNADKLLICDVKSVDNTLYSIVTNDLSLTMGEIVAVALDGAKLFDGKIVQKGNIRGIPSDGMFCGLKELGLDVKDFPNTTDDSVLKLPRKVSVGTDINEFLGRNDIVLDISITANRADANSILGIARELAAITGKELKFKHTDITIDRCSPIKCDNLAPDLCKRYMGCIINNIVITDSPDFVKQRLRNVGIRPINNIVDITNYILITIGQPMHVFDYDKIAGDTIVIRNATNDEKISALDGNLYQLNDSMLTICNSNDPMAIAGIMGGQLYSVSSNTSKVLFESANFSRENIRKTSRFLGLHSDSSARFEKGIDLYSQELGMQLAIQLIETYNWGIVDSYFDTMLQQPLQKEVCFSIEQIQKILGVKVYVEEVTSVLSSLGFDVSLHDSLILSKIPRWREDIFGINDIAEEIIRILGYDRFNLVHMEKSTTLTLGSKTLLQKREDKIKDILAGDGFSEIVNYSFITPKFIEIMRYPLEIEKSLIYISNPLSEEYSVMRNSLCFSMIKALSINFIRGNKIVNLFEIANVYSSQESPLVSLPNEKPSLCIGSYGIDFYDFKASLDNLFYVLRINVSYIRDTISFLHPYRCATIIDNSTGQSIGFYGEIRSIVSKDFKIEDKAYIAEIDMNYLVRNSYDYLSFKPISKYQVSERDISIILDKEIEAANIVKLIKDTASKILTNAFIFDVYTGSQIDNKDKSVAIKMKFQSMDHTLVDSEINAEIDKILIALQTNFNAKLR